MLPLAMTLHLLLRRHAPVLSLAAGSTSWLHGS